jgi:aspartate/methionine/tyrosine aminotransferase
MARLAASLDRLGTETAFEVLARAKALEASGRRVIHLEIGEPDFETPAHIVEAGMEALRDGHTHYCPAPGLPALREACAEHLSRHRRLAIDPARVLVAPGAKPFLFFGVLATCDPGDEVIYPNPGFPIYESVIRWAGATPVPLPIVEERGFAFSADDLEERLSPRTKLVILNSPANPTGGVISKKDLETIANLLRDRDVIILSDEIYSRIYYEAEPESITQFPGMVEKTIILDGFSKTYSMTGWRLGYGVMPKWIADAVNLMAVNATSCTASFTQRAGIAALTGPQDAVGMMVAEFRKRRDAMVQALNTVPGFRCTVPAGAFYAFPNVTGTGMPSKELADFLLNEAGVACLNGTAFGRHGDGYLRFSYANSLANIMEAIDRIKKVSAKWAAHV